jgi:hypothetical protein
MQDIKTRSRHLKYSKTRSGASVAHPRVMRNADLSWRDTASNSDYDNYDTSNKINTKKEDVYDYYRAPQKRNINDEESSGHENKSGRKKSVFVFVLIVLIVIFLLATFIFNSAQVFITPKTLNFNFIESNSLHNIINSSTLKNFEVITIERSMERELARSGKKKVTSKAEGSITIYNNHSSNPQKLIKNTRFETVEGKIFRISESVTVPGKTDTAPGQIDIKVVADSVGEDYNIGPTKFSIPGFKGGDRYFTFYGESKTSMRGGANSEKLVVSSDDVDRAISDMSVELKDKIRSEAKAVNKEKFTPIISDIIFNFSDNLNEFESGSAQKFKLTAKAEVLFFDNSNFGNVMLLQNSPEYKNEQAEISNLNDLNISISEKDFPKSFLNATSVRISILGKPRLILKTDFEKLKQELAGRELNQDIFADVLTKYKTISEATVKISPIWVNDFPKNKNKIEIIESENN